MGFHLPRIQEREKHHMKEKVSVIIAVLALIGVAAVFGLQQAPQGSGTVSVTGDHTVAEDREEPSDPGTKMKAEDLRAGTVSSPDPDYPARESQTARSASTVVQPSGSDGPQLSEVPTREELFALQRQRRMERAIETGTLNELLETEAALEQDRLRRDEQKRARLASHRRNREMRKAARSRPLSESDNRQP
jgi:hypothetical protein